ncbi:transcription factor MYB1R1-like [Bidens hawaiensis]|uniref:transcription factor MYB1R1-like n=1 Tax=Bidens hawaiensis TaxID=980011 RepID=UPI004049AF63
MSQSQLQPAAGDSTSGCSGAGEIMLFGVRVKVDPMRKSVSMNNLSQYEQPVVINNNLDVSATVAAADTGYASADDAVRTQSNGARERKRGIPWTEDEHKLFLLGLQKVGKGDWRGISRNFVKTRTPTQVASHAQKYFLRKTNLNRRRRRSSLFDITTDSVAAMPIEEQQVVPQPSMVSLEQISSINGGSKPNHNPNPSPSPMLDLNLNRLPVSLNLSLSFDPGFKNGDGMISVN